MDNLASERVGVYARVSTGMQAEDGFSIAAQLAEMREYAARRGWTIVAEFVDAGVTGQTMDRPNLNTLVAAVEEHALDIVLVHELSRLSRSSVFDTFTIFDTLGRHSVGFASVKEPQFDLSTPTGRLFLTFIAGINQYYIDILRMHTKKAKRQRARDGLYNASIPPLGYQHTGDPKTPPIIVEEEAKVVRMAFEQYATGEYSYQQVADILNRAGLRTRKGRRFSKDTINDMIRNRFYTGQVVYKEGRRGRVGEIYSGLHEPIISEELWNEALKAREKHHHASRRFHKRKTKPYLLSQISHCHICGRRLRVQSAAKGDYYREMSIARGYDDCPNAQIGVHAEVLHRQIGAIVRELRLPLDWQEELAEIIGEDNEVSTLENRRARLVAQRRRLKEAYIRGEFEEDVDIYRRELERVRRELDQIPSEDDLVQIQQAAEVLESLSEIWDEADPADQRDLIRLMLRDVLVDVIQGCVLFLRPAAPFIPLFRAIHLLQERDMGIFTPAWPDEMTDTFPYPALQPLAVLPEEPADLPFLPVWPWAPDPSARISPVLSTVLKARRQEGCEDGTVVTVPEPGVPSILLDVRKWPQVSLEELPLSEVLDRPDGSVAFLDTSFVLQRHSAPGKLALAVFQLLEQEGYWYIVDIVPSSMPAHWVFTFFPEAWSCAEGSTWGAYDFYNVLRRTGFQIEQEERTFHQSVTLKVALEIARRRPGILAAVSDEVYQEGMRRLEQAVKEQGDDNLITSAVTVVEIVALKGKEKPPKRRRRKQRVDTGRK